MRIGVNSTSPRHTSSVWKYARSDDRQELPLAERLHQLRVDERRLPRARFRIEHDDVLSEDEVQ
jgi:hypothetical protein